MVSGAVEQPVVTSGCGPRRSIATGHASAVRIALLGLGQVGAAVARRATSAGARPAGGVQVLGALVRRPDARAGTYTFPLTADAASLLDAGPDAVVELLGGVEPARALTLDALERRIPVVTANKTLLAWHGVELFDAATDSGTPLLYEASVVAGVPFLGTFARRPLAASVDRICGVVNGTSNFLLGRLEAGSGFGKALEAARELGIAESDPHKDVDGIDAAEKLAVLLLQFGRLAISPARIHTSGIRSLLPDDLRLAREFGGTIKPVVFADWSDSVVRAWAGPAFVSARHPLAPLPGVQNGVCVGDDLFFSGPGAGPDATAATVLDDVFEATRPGAPECVRRAPAGARVDADESREWFVRLTAPGGSGLPAGEDLADLLGAFGVWLRRVSEPSISTRRGTQWFLTYPSTRSRLTTALLAVGHSSGCHSQALPALEVVHG